MLQSIASMGEGRSGGARRNDPDLGALPAKAACQWTQRAGKPYIACDPGPPSLSPPVNRTRQPAPPPDVQPPPLAETPPQPPVAGTPAPPLAPAAPLGPSITPERGAALPRSHSQPPPTLNPGAPGLLSPRGGAPACRALSEIPRMASALTPPLSRREREARSAGEGEGQAACGRFSGGAMNSGPTGCGTHSAMMRSISAIADVIEMPAHDAVDRIELRRLARAPQRHAHAGAIEQPAQREVNHPLAEALLSEAVKSSAPPPGT